MYKNILLNIFNNMEETKRFSNIITIDMNFKDLGVDSLSFVKFIINIENEFEISFPLEKMTYNISGSLVKLNDIITEIKGSIKNE